MLKQIETINEATKMKCSECGRTIPYGGDLIKDEKCVRGPRGIVPLGEIQYFCCEDCVSLYFGNNSGSESFVKAPPRIP